MSEVASEPERQHARRPATPGVGEMRVVSESAVWRGAHRWGGVVSELSSELSMRCARRTTTPSASGVVA
ncbi:hypothetical protein K7711_27015 [Nocardia sp. CA2R105]|uniref:hypothetical protein n=1 Tax=Nocardia coffeae TaxID=2873381 RepID=UPI001CA7186D|nr:hypothetical protein [Nocardia coffeae]MBY8860149.1 hypothetical protein [Nocardia coffeae]